MDQVQQLLKRNKQLSDFIYQSLQACSGRDDTADEKSVGPLLQRVLHNIAQNSGKAPKQRRHDTVLKKFATVLYIFAGAMAYEFLHQNLPQALPSLRTVQGIVYSQYTHIEEGKFRFNELVEHLSKHNLPYLVTIAEDATRIVRRVEYDSATNRCVGFVIPSNESGFLQIDTYLAVSFNAIEHMFTTSTIAKYAYMYIAQPLQEGAPSFCLACVGTDNKFSAAEVIKRWKYIYTELDKRGVKIINFDADGDSRLLHAMRVALNMTSDPLSEISLNKCLMSSALPAFLQHWLYIQKIPSVLCVQDIVHIGVKLKARFLKPSIILPFGNYFATSSHLQILVKLKGKEQHGLRSRDLDHRDKQNFDAVEHIIKASRLLDCMPDALGTRCFIGLINSVIYSFLDKSMVPAKRLEEIWYAAFFLRYWHQWILDHPMFTLKENFVTSNAYMCVEINAHSLLMLLLILRDTLPDSHGRFLPWMLGSQSCERTFRALRSMTSTFSTMINFSVLGLLQRLHKLYIQEELQSQTEKDSHGISFPRQEKYGKKKDGYAHFESIRFVRLHYKNH